MIAYLTGNLTFKSPTHVYLECGGVGYYVQISLNTYTHIQPLEKVKLYTHLYISGQNDTYTIYGFFTEAEKEMFVQLISVSGVGPSSARLLLSSLTTSEIQHAIIREDISLLQKTKGIGQKTVQRLVLELKDKVAKISGETETIMGMEAKNHPLRDEALAALAMLGFQRAASEKVVSKILQENKSLHSVEELIKLSLKNL